MQDIFKLRGYQGYFRREALTAKHRAYLAERGRQPQGYWALHPWRPGFHAYTQVVLIHERHLIPLTEMERARSRRLLTWMRRR